MRGLTDKQTKSKLTILNVSSANPYKVVCRCVCGTIKEMYRSVYNRVKSCGCMKKELVSKALRQHNTFIHKDDHVIGITKSGKQFMIDTQDYDQVSQHCWHITSNGYVCTHITINNKRSVILLHRFILNPQDSLDVDHRDLDKLNNRRSNLRECTPSNNAMNTTISKRNTSGVKGVYWRKAANKWLAVIFVRGKYIHLGLFKDKEDAIKTRKEAEKEYFGEYSYEEVSTS